MRNFKLYVYNRKYKRLLTKFDNLDTTNHIEPFSTFNEKLTEGENDQFNLSFSMSGFVYNNGVMTKNFWLDIIKIGSRILIELDNGIKEIRLIINKITPIISIDNIIYQFDAQDEISYLWAKHNLGYSYSNIDTGVQDIYVITRNVLKDNWLNSEWTVLDTEGKTIANALRTKPITLEVLDSNPYNVIIEACNTLNCFMKIDYHNQQITFYQKDSIPFSGYRYRPEINLQSLSANYESTNFTTMLHVTGGENEYGEIITLVPALPTAIQTALLENFLDENKEPSWPDDLWNNNILIESIPNYYITNSDTEDRNNEIIEINNFLNIARQIPHLGQFILDFEYFLKSTLLTQNDKDILNHLFNIQMRDNNIYLKIYTPIKYRIEWMVQQILNEIYNFGTEYQAECQYIQQRAEENDDNAKFTATEESKQNISIINEKIVKACTNNNYELFYNMTMLHGIGNNKLPFKEFPEIQEWLEKQTYYNNKTISTQEQINNIKIQLQNFLDEDNQPKDPNNPTYMELNSQLALLEKNIITYRTLGPGWSIDAWGQTYWVKGLYEYLISVLEEQYDYAWDNNFLENISNINNLINIYEENNKKLWSQIYRNYGEFIYEAQYDNSDELDSVSLFNQGMTYFEQQKRPIPNYSISVLDLGSLECIGTPRLSIGSKIRIYNDKLNLNDKQEDIISYSDNELIITEITSELRNAAKVSISVQKVDSYQKIIEKLLLSIKN